MQQYNSIRSSQNFCKDLRATSCSWFIAAFADAKYRQYVSMVWLKSGQLSWSAVNSSLVKIGQEY